MFAWVEKSQSKYIILINIDDINFSGKISIITKTGNTFIKVMMRYSLIRYHTLRKNTDAMNMFYKEYTKIKAFQSNDALFFSDNVLP